MTRIYQLRCPGCKKYQEVKETASNVVCRFCGGKYRLLVDYDCFTDHTSKRLLTEAEYNAWRKQ